MVQNRKWIYGILWMLSALLFVGVRADKVYAASNLAITDITVEKGSSGIPELEDKGYQVVYQNFNTSVKGSNIYVGYKRGSGTAITNLLVSGKNQQSLTVEGIQYNRVSDINLNTGSSGDARYLYYTTDTKAGTSIIAFDTNVYNANGDIQQAGYALSNDGASPVRDENGIAANLEKGKKDTYAYLMMIREGLYRPFISQVCIACASNKRAAIEKLSGLQCDYYLDEEFSTTDSSKIMMVGYSRSVQEEEALTSMVEMDLGNAGMLSDTGLLLNGVEYDSVDAEEWDTYGSGLFSTKDTSAGNPIYDLIVSDIDGIEMTIKEWAVGQSASSGFGEAASHMYQEAAYQESQLDETVLQTISMLHSNNGEMERAMITFLRPMGEVPNLSWKADVSELTPALTMAGMDFIEEETEETESTVATEEISSEEEENLLENVDDLEEEENLVEVDVDELQEDQVDLPEEEVILEGNAGSVFSKNGTGIAFALISIVILLACIAVFMKMKQSNMKEKEGSKIENKKSGK